MFSVSFCFLKMVDSYSLATSAVQYYRYHDNIDTTFGIAKESLGIASIGYN